MKYFCRVGKSNQIADSTIGKNAGIYVWKMEGELFQLFTFQGIAEKCGRCLPYFAYLIKCNPGSRQCNFPTYLCPSINSCELVWKTAGKTNRPPWKTLWKWLTKGQSVRRAGKLALLQWNKLQISGGNWKFIGKGEEVWFEVWCFFLSTIILLFLTFFRWIRWVTQKKRAAIDDPCCQDTKWQHFASQSEKETFPIFPFLWEALKISSTRAHFSCFLWSATKYATHAAEASAESFLFPFPFSLTRFIISYA